MLSANFGSGSPNFNLSDPWWIKEVAASYAHVMLSDFFDSGAYNGTGSECALVTVARALKKANPKIKVLVYVAAELVAGRPDAQAVIREHPEWWLHNDNGTVVQPQEPWVNFTIPSFQEWFSGYVPGWYGDEATALFDGLFVDAGGYQPAQYHRNKLFVKDPPKYNEFFLAKMAMLKKAQEKYAALNDGMVIANQALGHWVETYATWPDMDWRTNVGLMGGGSFVEWFGSLEMDNDHDGSWNIGQMEKAFKGVIESSQAGYPVVLKAAPGPVHMHFERRCSTTPPSSCANSSNYFHVLEWASAEKIAQSADGARAEVQQRLVQTLAPFLIVAEPNVFFSYAWFYGLEDGYIPCPKDAECGMPSSWFPEFAKPLGRPDGAAVQNGTIWTRSFQHASVFVDLANRTACKIDWY
jgi:hypothetical protein